MAYLNLNGVRLHYTDTGPDAGLGDVAVVFSHGLLFSTEMFEEQIAHLKAGYRCIAYDHRGQGQSGAPEGEYDMDTLAGDAAALITALGVEKCHFVGLSMGEVKMPTLIVVGDEDTATVPEKSERMHAAISGSKYMLVPQGGHVSTIDAPEAINAALSGFFDKVDGAWIKESTPVG